MSLVSYVEACPHCCKQEHRTLQLLHNHRTYFLGTVMSKTGISADQQLHHV
jgi:hypothetical protein